MTAPMMPNISGYKKKSIPNFTPEQMQLFQSLFQHLQPGSYLARLAGGEEGMFDEMEAPALRQFSGTLGNIGSKFAGMGQGAMRSSGFKNTLSQAASDFSQDLQSRRQELQRQAIMDLLGLSGQLLGQQPYQSTYQPKQPSFLQSLVGGASSGAIGGVGKLLGGLF